MCECMCECVCVCVCECVCVCVCVCMQKGGERVVLLHSKLKERLKYCHPKTST